MFQKIKDKIKNLFSFLKEVNRERGDALLTTLLVLSLIATIGSVASPAIAKWLGEKGKELLRALLMFFMGLCQSFAVISIDITTSVLDLPFLQSAITKNAVTTEGFNFTRDLTNMLIVLGFVLVGIATILRIQEYQAQKKLLPLILIAILINFSPLICGFIIDASNIAMDYFLTRGGHGGALLGEFKLMLIGPNFKDQIDKAIKDVMENEVLGMLAFTGYAFFAILIGATLFMLAIILVVRHFVLVLLVILSPLAFFCYIFGFTKNYWNVWWQNFLKYCFIGVGMAFCIFLASHLIINPQVFQQQTIQTGATQPGTAPTPAEASASLLRVWMPVTFLWIGYKLAKTSSIMGANAIMSAAKVAGGFALGAGVWAAQRMGKGIAKSRAGQWVGDKMTAISEHIPLVGAAPGTLAKRQEERQKESSARLERLDSERLAKIATGKAVTARAANDKAVAARILAERGGFDKIPTLEGRTAAMNYAVARGTPRSIFEKADPRLAATSPKVEEYIKQGMSREDAEQKAIRETVQRLNTTELNNLRGEAFTASIPHMTPGQIEQVAHRIPDSVSPSSFVSKLTPKAMGKLSPKVIDNIDVSTLNPKVVKGLARGTSEQIDVIKAKLPALEAKVLAEYKKKTPDGDKEGDRLTAIHGAIERL